MQCHVGCWDQTGPNIGWEPFIPCNLSGSWRKLPCKAWVTGIFIRQVRALLVYTKSFLQKKSSNRLFRLKHRIESIIDGVLGRITPRVHALRPNGPVSLRSTDHKTARSKFWTSCYAWWPARWATRMWRINLLTNYFLVIRPVGKLLRVSQFRSRRNCPDKFVEPVGSHQTRIHKIQKPTQGRLLYLARPEGWIWALDRENPSHCLIPIRGLLSANSGHRLLFIIKLLPLFDTSV